MVQLYSVNSDAIIFPYDQKFKGSEFKDGSILIIAVDSMKERKKIHAAIKKAKLTPQLIIDGRMGGPQLEVYTCTTMDEWEESFNDNPAKDSCGARYICYISMVIGAFIANQVKRYINNQPYKKSILFNIDALQLI